MKKIVGFSGCIVLLLCLMAAAGCGVGYDAQLLNNADRWMSEEFLRENRVRAFYPNEQYNENDESSEPYIYDDAAPETRVFIIGDRAMFDEIFTGHVPSADFEAADFESEIVLLYIFPNMYPTREYKLQKVEVDGAKVRVFVELEKRTGVGDAAMPAQSCLMVKMDKIPVDCAEFIEQ